MRVFHVLFGSLSYLLVVAVLVATVAAWVGGRGAGRAPAAGTDPVAGVALAADVLHPCSEGPRLRR